MTREEAARILGNPVYKWSLDWDEREDGLAYCDAIQMAIAALRAQQEPNPPLTLEELRGMDGEPVWVCNPQDVRQGHWAIIRNDRFDVPEYNYCAYAVGVCWHFSDYGRTWLAYRRKPEEGTV